MRRRALAWRPLVHLAAGGRHRLRELPKVRRPAGQVAGIMVVRRQPSRAEDRHRPAASEIARAPLVGETIGERPNSYSENDEMRLPHSQMEISYSTRYYKFLPHDGLVTPDKEILPAWADWVAAAIRSSTGSSSSRGSPSLAAGRRPAAAHRHRR